MEKTPARDGEDAPVETDTPEGDSEAARGEAVYTLVMLQREGRLIDFLLENIDAYSDAQVGAAARQIHAGCANVLQQCFEVVPIREESEGSRVELPDDFDPRHIRLTGRTDTEPPFAGVLRHRGWRATKVDFPRRHALLDASVICPAEIEM